MMGSGGRAVKNTRRNSNRTEAPVAKDKNRSNKEVRKPKKAKPEAKPPAIGERVPGKIVTQPKQPSN
jgi:hypothetical protein